MIKSFNLTYEELDNYKYIKNLYDDFIGFKMTEKQFFNLMLNAVYHELPQKHGLPRKSEK